MVDLDDYKTTLVSNLLSAWKAAKANIEKAQDKQKYYDRKSVPTSLKAGDHVLVYMLIEAQRKRSQAISRPVHTVYEL